VESNDLENDGGELGYENGIKYVYCDDPWKQKHFTYDPKSQEFVEVLKPNLVWNQSPTMIQLFDLFWSFNILQDIVNKTNQYTILRISDDGIEGGNSWILFTVSEFKA
jgi:hypothetical protein